MMRAPHNRQSEMPDSIGAAIAVAFVWFIVGLIFPPVAALGMTILTWTVGIASASICGAVVGAWHGFAVGWGAVETIMTLTFKHAPVESVVLGAFAGAVIAWVITALSVREKDSPIISALFTADLWQKGGFAFFAMLFTHAIAGYVVVHAFASVGMIAASGSGVGPDLGTVVVIAGGAFGGSGGGDFFYSIVNFFLALAAFVVAGGVVASVIGSAIGSVSAVGVWLFDMNAAVQGAAQGASVHWLLGKREGANTSKKLVLYVLFGALSGASEGVMVGAIVGAIFGSSHIVG